MQIRRLRQDEVPHAGRLAARAFWSDPAWRFLFPEGGRREAASIHLWTAASRYALHYGEVWATPGLEGVACWLPPGQGHKTLGRMVRAGMWRFFYQLPPGVLARNVANDQYSEGLHALHAPGPHWYLMILAVEPACQGQGIGSALLCPMLRRLDKDQLPAYLETHNPRNLPFYERHGFAVVAKGTVPGSAVTAFFMLRAAGPG